ncbi:nucleotidyl transferase AbiEii/AbiGii toxin family protein, partial [Vineibacter terrae]|uniref:nucleotidyl transferase AbiEii/AbiGii toxin family protein n=1 Tax=Vineibacter terrae TaxID=2586908 RepID=UPI002E321E4B
MAASVRARLLNIAKERNQPFDLLLTRYVLERLLYRLSTSRHRERFVLKGDMLVATWFDGPFRPTRDLDLLGFGDPDVDVMLRVFREICGIEINDGVLFDVPVPLSIVSARSWSTAGFASRRPPPRAARASRSRSRSA